jgi:hypothetical protein
MHIMSRIHSTATSAGLIGLGVCAWAFAGRPLVDHPDLNIPLNPLGINGSPYGEVIAMAMQGPIDNHFHGAVSNGHDHDEPHDAEASKQADDDSAFSKMLEFLDRAVATRTNPKASSSAHKFYLRRKVEDKMRFAYNLDPSHYANYNSLHFFLTEPQLGTRPQLTASAAKLAEDTIQYCLKQQGDPRPALTAAAAASNVLELMCNDQRNETPKFNTVQMRQYLGLLDHCINRYVHMAKEWDSTKQWDLLSPQRIAECDERFEYIMKFRGLAEGAISRYEKKAHPVQVAN